VKRGGEGGEQGEEKEARGQLRGQSGVKSLAGWIYLPGRRLSV